MLTDSPPRKANCAGFLESDRIKTLDLPQDGFLLGCAKSIESAMKAGTNVDVRRACRLGLGLEILDPKFIRPPRVPRREVIFLAPEEIEKFLSVIPVFSGKHRADLKWLCFRSLVEVLLGTGMRISEALSLKRSSVNFETGEARIIGKRNKERTVFFNTRALAWIKEFITHRNDAAEWLFVLPNGKRLEYSPVGKWFAITRARAGLLKKVTPHILRHTMATTSLQWLSDWVYQRDFGTR